MYLCQKSSKTGSRSEKPEELRSRRKQFDQLFQKTSDSCRKERIRRKYGAQSRPKNPYFFSEQEVREIVYQALPYISNEGNVTKKNLLGCLKPEDEFRRSFFPKALARFDFLAPGSMSGAWYRLNLRKVSEAIEIVESLNRPVVDYKELVPRFVQLELCSTVKRPLSNVDLLTLAVEDSPICWICSETFDTPVSWSTHFQKTHASVGNRTLRLVKSKGNPHSQLFRIECMPDPNFTEVLVSVKNISKTKLRINRIQLVYHTDDIITPDLDWPLTAQSVEFTLTRQHFKQPRRYFVLIHAQDTAEFVEIHRMNIRDSVDKISFKMRREKFQKDHFKSNFSKLPEYYPKKESLMKLFNEDFELKPVFDTLTVDEKKRFNYLTEVHELSHGNYQEILKLLVEIEDLHTIHLFEGFQFSVPYVTEGNNDNFVLEVPADVQLPGMVQETDTLFLQRNERIHRFEVVKVDGGTITFQSRKKDLELIGSFRVRIKKNRFCFRMEQEGLHKMDIGEIGKQVFPRVFGVKKPEFKVSDFQWFNSSIGRNFEQQQTIINIVNATSYPAPYICFGPPGTGKTATLVETIMQIWKLKPSANILVTAQSNAACDEIASRLLKFLPPEEIYRYYSSKVKQKDGFMDEVTAVSNKNPKDPFFEPHTITSVMFKFRINIMTLVMAGRLALDPVKTRNHFSYIIIDEGSSATESAMLIPIVGFLSAVLKTNLVIAGDPHQLGPVVTCRFASMAGLGRSMLERLMHLRLYQPNAAGNYNEKLITKLVLNFRSHEEILKVPNELFYEDELVCCAPKRITSWALGWDPLPNKKIPMMFHSVNGKQRKEINDFSIYNGYEIQMVIEYVKKIVEEGVNGQKIPMDEIGIVSPYRLQCMKIKKHLEDWGWNDIDVGPAETFQGREKMVIILSTVRSNTTTIGFLNSPKRLNVVITRAKGLLIMIGNAKTLQLDYNWYKLIKHCKDSKLVLGKPFKLKKPSGVEEDCYGNALMTDEEKLQRTISDFTTRLHKLGIVQI